MKLHMVKKGVFSSILFATLVSSAYAGHAAKMVQPPQAPGSFYVGIFGGGGSSGKFNVNQYGTAFFTEAEGGPLAVNAFGSTGSQSTWLVGGQVGFKARDIAIDSEWSLTPAVELETYYFGSQSFSGHLGNDTTRLPEHDFAVTYPMNRSVYLANAVLNINNLCYRFHPYVGAGFGGAIVRINGATAAQVAPPEVGINHYNANGSDAAPTFAGQVKAGLSYDVNEWISVFAEYRWLYLSTTHFTFGSTVYPTHVPTSSWQVTVGRQEYNMGTAGIRFAL